MIKIIHNNLIIDLNTQERYVRYLPQSKRFITSKKETANGIIGSDSNTVYHLNGTVKNFPTELKTVTVQQISEEEYEKLSTQLMFEKTQQSDLKQEVDTLKQLVQQQNDLIQQLLNKFS